MIDRNGRWTGMFGRTTLAAAVAGIGALALPSVAGAQQSQQNQQKQDEMRTYRGWDYGGSANYDASYKDPYTEYGLYRYGGNDNIDQFRDDVRSRKRDRWDDTEYRTYDEPDIRSARRYDAGPPMRGRLITDPVALIGYDTDNDGRIDAWYEVDARDPGRLHREGSGIYREPDFQSVRDWDDVPQRSQRTDDWERGFRSQRASLRNDEQTLQQRREWEQRRSTTQDSFLDRRGAAGDGLYRSPREPSHDYMGQSTFPVYWNQPHSMQDRQDFSRGTESRTNLDGRSDMSSQRQRGMEMGQPQRFSGTLEDIETYSFHGSDSEQVVGKLRLDDGRTVSVHLGLKSALAEELNAGDRVTVYGHTSNLQQRTIILAEQTELSREKSDQRQRMQR